MNCIIAEGTAQASNAAKIIRYKFLRSALPLALVLLTGCGGGSSPPPAMLGPAPTPTPTPTPTLGPMGGAIQGTPLNLTKTVSTFAGSASANLDGTGTAARFWAPFATISDGTNLYVADALNNTIRKIVLATGVVTTLAGSGVAGAADGTGTAAMFKSPQGIATDGANLYVADTGNSKIRKIVLATGAVTTLAGSPMNALGAADGTGTAATFANPVGIAIDSTGTNLYVADTWNNKIRKVVIATGAVSSFTGVANTASVAGAADGAAAAATFWGPVGITTDGANLYVADSWNNKIRKIVIATGVVSSFTGVANMASVAGAADGAATAATFSTPNGITTDGTNLYVTDSWNNKIRQIVIASGVVSSVTGIANTAALWGATDGAGAAATFNLPAGITTDGHSLFVTDNLNNTIRRIQ